MRVNVYGEELPNDLDVRSVAHLSTSAGRMFYGVRMFLKSPEELHHSPNDDDRSAVTIWVPWTREKGHDFAKVRVILTGMINALVGQEEDVKRIEEGRKG